MLMELKTKLSDSMGQTDRITVLQQKMGHLSHAYNSNGAGHNVLPQNSENWPCRTSHESTPT